MAKKDETIPAIAGLTFEQLQECLGLGASLEQITSLAEGGFGYEQIKTLASTLGVAKGSGGGVTAADLKSLMQAQHKALRPENDRDPEISAFSHPEGNVARPKPTLRRVTIFLGGRVKDDDLTPLEIELFNRFDVSKTARNGRWTADIRNIDGVERLIVKAAEHNTIDGRASLPGISMMLRELLDGPEATNPDTLAERVKQLEARIKEMAQPAGAAA